MNVEVKRPPNTASIASSLHAGQTPSVHGEGDYSFTPEGVVWEFDPTYEGNAGHQKPVPIGEWLGGLSVACDVELTATEISEIAFRLGGLIGRRQ